MSDYEDVPLFIAGSWRAAVAGRDLPVENPATGKVIGRVACAERADLDAALDAASKGFEAWKAVSAYERYKVMRRAAELVRERAEAIALKMSLEQGKPLGEARMETLAGADLIEWFAEEGRRVYGRIVPARAGNVAQLVMREPVGVVAGFSPWNFPINQAVRKLSSAVAAGCSIILKGPEETPASCAGLVGCFADAGLPEGVVNLVFGVPKDISDYLIPHPTVKKITFTGSTSVGKQLAAMAGAHMKRATMELGGHAPVIVCSDADIKKAVGILVANKYRNAGQVCVSPTRFLLQNDIAEEFTERFVEGAKAIKVGPGTAEGVQMGALANDRRVDAMDRMVSDAVQRGAKCLTGGKRIGNEGNFFEPTVLADVPTDAEIMNEEPFGPVAILNRFDGIEDALAEANRLPFGLASYAYTASLTQADRIIRGVEAGMLSMNHHGIALPETPFGGIKDSGYGTEGGADALEGYLNTKFVTQAAS